MNALEEIQSKHGDDPINDALAILGRVLVSKTKLGIDTLVKVMLWVA